MAAAVEHLLRARARREPGPPVTEAVGPLELEDAYVVQQALQAALEARGERVVGWKVAFTSAAVQAGYGMREPAGAFLLASGVVGAGATLSMERFVAPGVEVEMAFLLRAPLAGPGVTPASALLAVEGVLPALEIVDFRYAGSPRGVDLVADGVLAAAVVLGRPLTPAAGLDLALEGVVYELDGRLAATAAGAEVLGNPLHALAWLANHLGAQGRGLRAGDVVLTGSISKILRVTAGQTVRASFTRIGSVACRFE